jgi:hypothetical protein
MPDTFAPTTCFSCGRKGVGIHDVDAMSPIARACSRCLRKHGQAALRNEADRLLATWFGPGGEGRKTDPGAAAGPSDRRQPGECFHCRGPVLERPNGGFPLWCQECDRMRKNLIASSRAPMPKAELAALKASEQ